MKQRGDAHFAEEQTALALADYERALDLGGPDLDIRIALGRVHYEIDNYEAARAVLDRAVALDAESPEAHYWHGLVLYGLGRNHDAVVARSEEHTSELQSLMRISYAVVCLKKKTSLSTKLHEHTITQPYTHDNKQE